MICKISTTALVLVLTTLAAGALAAAFDNYQPSFGELSTTSAAENRVQAKRTRSAEPVQLCGYRLLETVRGLCTAYTAPQRRSDPSMLSSLFGEVGMPMSNSLDSESNPQYSNDAYVDNSAPDYPDTDTPWTRNPKMLALKVLTEGKLHQRFRRNIIDECCKRPCTFNHMLKYCGRT